MIKYTIQKKKNPTTKEEKYYVQIAPTEPVEQDEIIDRIEKRSTVSSADCKAVLDALEYEIKQALKDGKSVRLGNLGSFRPTLTSEGEATAAAARKKGARLIKSVNVQYTKSTGIRDALQLQFLNFAYAGTIESPSTPESGNGSEA